MRIAVVGATGMVGQVMLKVLAERNFPITELYLVASEKSVGKEITFGGSKFKVIGLEQCLTLKPVRTSGLSSIRNQTKRRP